MPARRLMPLLGLFLLSIVPFSSAAEAEEHTAYPLTLKNCGHTLTFTSAPKRAVTLGQASTELLLSLGLADRMVGTGIWFGPVQPTLKADNDKIPRLADNAPSFEAVASTVPDLVAAQYTYHVGPNGEVATFEQLASLGIPAYVAPSDCEGKEVTATSNADGSRTKPFTLGLITQEIQELARIFDVQSRGEVLVHQLERRLERAVAGARQHRRSPQSVAYWFSSSRLEGDPWVAGQQGVPAYISQVLGLDNIIQSNDEWPSVSWEHIAAKDPDLIVITRMDRRLYPADDVEKKLAFLRSDPVTRQLKAVRNNQIIIVDAQSLNPSMRVLDGIEAISKALATSHTEPSR
ncbi:ABC transporter substrate-binding protein [Pseudomonas asuensis]